MTNLKNNYQNIRIIIAQDVFMNQMMKSTYSVLAHNSVPYIESTELLIIMKYLKMT